MGGTGAVLCIMQLESERTTPRDSVSIPELNHFHLISHVGYGAIETDLYAEMLDADKS